MHAHIWYFHLCIVILCYKSIVAVTEVPTQDLSLNRLSYGVYFTHVAKYRPTIENYILTYSIHIIDVWQKHDVVDGIVEALKSQLQHTMSSHTKCHHAFTLSKTQYSEKDDAFCPNSLEFLYFALDTALEAHITKNTLLNAIKSILDRPTPTTRFSRDNWNPLHSLGRIFSSVFGLVSAEDLEKAYSAIQTIIKDRNENVDFIKKLSNDFASYVTLTNDQIQRIEREAHIARHQLLGLIEQVHNSTLSQMNYITALAIQAGKIQNIVNSVVESYSILLSSLQFLHMGILSPTILPPDVLESSLQHISQELNNARFSSFLVHDDTMYYYTKAKYTFAVYKEKLIITLFVPLSSFSEDQDVYEIRTFPLPMHDHKSQHTLRITNLPTALAISNRTKTYVEITKDELEIIKHSKEIEPMRVFTKFHSQSCIAALYMNDKRAVNASCSYIIDMYSKTSAVTHLMHSTFIMQNIENYMLTCQGNDHLVIGCDLCARRVPSGCSIFTTSIIIPAAIKNDTFGLQGHILNLPLLMKLFSPKTLEDMTGEKLFEHSPTIIVPNFKFFNDQLTEDIRKDENAEISLSRAVNAISQDAKIASSMSEAMLLQYLNIPINYWSSEVGIIQASTSALLLLLILFCVFQFLQLRKLAIIVVTLQNTLQARASVTLLYRQAIPQLFDTFTTPNTTPTSLILLHSEKPNWTAMIICLLAFVAMIIFALRRLYQRRRKANSLMFGLQFIATDNTVFIPTQPLFGTPTNYRLAFTEAPTNFAIVGFVLPTLTFTWPTVVMRDVVMNANVPIVTTLNLPISVAYHLRNITQTAHYYVIPVFMYRDRIVRPDLELELHERIVPTPPPRNNQHIYDNIV